ncbi:MAG: hypothetical protein HC855_15660 [Rhizobiales bacterium]|nr:hypothetical protein [Hyphomicrobiales bacterium]
MSEKIPFSTDGENMIDEGLRALNGLIGVMDHRQLGVCGDDLCSLLGLIHRKIEEGSEINSKIVMGVLDRLNAERNTYAEIRQRRRMSAIIKRVLAEQEAKRACENEAGN